MTHTHKQRQRGDAMVIVLIILGVALLGGLGYVFWKNQKAPANTTTSQNSAEAPATATTEVGGPFATKFTVTYPENWKREVKVEGQNPEQDRDAANFEPTYETVTFTSPSGDVQVKYFMGNTGGIGGTCNLEDPSYKLTRAVYTDIPGVKGWGVGEFTKADNWAMSAAGIYKDREFKDGIALKDIKVGDSWCYVNVNDYISVDNPNTTTEEYLMTASVLFPKEQKVEDHSLDMGSEQVKKLLASDDYKTAKEILLSTKQK